MKRSVLYFILAMVLVVPCTGITADQSQKLKILEIHVDDWSDNNSRIFHVNQEVVPGGESFTCINSETSCKDATFPATIALRRWIFTIPGVVTVRFEDRYRIVVTKGESFHWGDIQPRVIKAIEDVFPAEQTNIREPNNLPTKRKPSRGKDISDKREI